MEWHLATDRGVTFADNRTPLVARFPHYAAQIEAWETRWWDMFSGPIPETKAAIEALHAAGTPQFVLPNMSAQTVDRTFAMSPAFRRIADRGISGRAGVLKPDPAFFRLACARRSPETG